MNHVGVPVANSDEISAAAAVALVRASEYRDDGRTPRIAREAERLDAGQ